MLIIVFWLTVAILLYVYIGYPCLMAAASVMLASKSTDHRLTPTISLIIPAHNEAEVIVQKLDNAMALDYPRDKLEILVGSDNSTDHTVQLAEAFADRGVEVISFAARRGKASVLNDLVVAARGEVLMLCDANVMFHNDALQRLVARLADPAVGAVTGDVRIRSEDCSFGMGERLYYCLERRIQLGESAVGSLMGVDGGMYVLRKCLFAPVPADTILDDFVISMNVIRRGKRVVFEPTAIADENATPFARSEFRRRMRVSAGAMQSVLRGNLPPLWRPVELWQYISHKWLRWCVPTLLAALLVSSACLLPIGLVYRLAFGAQVVGYSLAVAGAISVQIRKSSLVGIPFYFVLTFVAMFAGAFKALFIAQSGVWTKTERKVSVA